MGPINKGANKGTRKGCLCPTPSFQDMGNNKCIVGAMACPRLGVLPDFATALVHPFRALSCSLYLDIIEQADTFPLLQKSVQS